MKASLVIFQIFHYTHHLSGLFFWLSAVFLLNLPKSKQNFEPLIRREAKYITHQQKAHSFLFCSMVLALALIPQFQHTTQFTSLVRKETEKCMRSNAVFAHGVLA